MCFNFDYPDYLGVKTWENQRVKLYSRGINRKNRQEMYHSQPSNADAV